MVLNDFRDFRANSVVLGQLVVLVLWEIPEQRVLPEVLGQRVLLVSLD
jgi:hypothetical protein